MLHIYIYVVFKACGNLTSLPNGEYILVNVSNVLYNATANVTCNPGYDPNVTSVSCLESGMWEIAECKVKGALTIIRNSFVSNNINIYILT